MQSHFWCLIFVSISFPLLAQKPDSTYYISSTRTENAFGLAESSKEKDTLLDNIHNYYQTGVLGNMGLPSYSLIANKPQQGVSTFFNWNKLNNRNDLITEDDPLYFNTQKVYTKITAAIGQKQEQFLKLVHVQNIKKKVNVSLLFNRYSCTGFYLQQQSLTTNILLSSNYKTDDGRWGYGFYFLFNKLKYQLNGGVPTGALQDSTTAAKNLYPFDPYFQSGTARQNIKTSTISFNTFYRLNGNDSARLSQYFVYETNYQSNYFLYVDGLNDTSASKNHFYSYAYDGSHDSTGSRIFSNSLLYKIATSNKNFILYGGYKNEAIKYHQHYIDTVGFNQILKGGAILKIKKHALYGTAEYVLSGFNKDNYDIHAHYDYHINSLFYLNAQAQTQSRLPDFNLLFYNGNRFIWNNNFSSIQTQDANISITNKKYKFYVGVYTQQQQNQIYFNTNALPTQYNGTTNITRLYIGKDLKLVHLHFNNYINYQTTPNKDVIRLPTWVTTHQLYYEGKLFKKNLWLQAGLQARYISSYMANAYSPATNQFYLQNEKNYGNYVFIDAFINFEIHPVKFFIMAQHVNQGLMGGNYILTPNYPMPDRSIKFGFIWTLFN